MSKLEVEDMKRVVKTYYDERLRNSQSYLSGFVFELEDGSIIVHCQEGHIQPTMKFEDSHTYSEWYKDRVGTL